MGRCLIVCAKRYNGHELWTLLGVLHNRGHTFEVVSQDKLIRDELTLRPNVIERTVWETKPEEEVQKNDAIVVVSGNMSDTEKYWTDDHVINLLKTFREHGKIVAAICCSVPTLAPVVQGVKVSFFPLVRSRHRLQRFGAILQTTSLTVDQLTVTAENQMMTQMWGEEICNLLESKPQKHKLHDSGFVPKGSERMMDPEIRKAIDSARGYRMSIKDPELKAKYEELYANDPVLRNLPEKPL